MTAIIPTRDAPAGVAENVIDLAGYLTFFQLDVPESEQSEVGTAEITREDGAGSEVVGMRVIIPAEQQTFCVPKGGQMLVGDVDKQPSERKRYEFDYAQWLGPDEAVTTLTASVDPDTVLDVEDIAVLEGGQAVELFVDGGADAVDYLITLLATTSKGQIKENEFMVRVAEQDGE